MIEEIPNEIQYRFPTKFSCFDYWYSTNELNIVYSVDQNAYQIKFGNASIHKISLYVMAKKIGINDNITITYPSKRTCNPESNGGVAIMKLNNHTICIWQDWIIII